MHHFHYKDGVLCAEDVRLDRLADEVGTPFGITIDGESLTNATVTVRDRDTLKQERIEAGQLKDYLTRMLAS